MLPNGGFMNRFLILIILSWATFSFASTGRTVDADFLKSSDHSKTYTLPSSSGTLALSSGTPVQQIPSGSINGSNTSFSLSNTPTATDSVKLFLDGGFLYQGSIYDYTISGTTINMNTAPALGQTLYATYLK